MTTVFHTLPYARFIEIQSNLMRKKLHRMNQDSYFPGGRFSNRDNVRSPIQFRRESQPQHLEKSFFLKNRPMAMGSGGTVNLFQRGRGKPTKNSEFQAIWGSKTGFGRNIKSNRFIIQKKHKRTNLNSSTTTAYRCLLEQERKKYITKTRHMVHFDNNMEFSIRTKLRTNVNAFKNK